MVKSWRKKLDGAKPPHLAELRKPFGDTPAGARMLISSPREVEEYVRAIPAGQIRSVAEMRGELARRAGADVTCPTSTGIFVRIVAEAALEDLHAGAEPQAIAPFWRLVDPGSPAAGRISCGPEFIRNMRQVEAAA